MLTVVICVGIIIGWQYLMGPMPGQKPAGQGQGQGQTQGQQSPQEGGTAGSGETKKASGTSAAGAEDPKAEVKAEPVKKGEGPRVKDTEGIHTALETPRAWGKFTDRGAALRSWKLKDPRYQQAESGKLEPVDLVAAAEGKGLWPLATVFPDSDFTLPEDARFTLKKKERMSVTYAWKSDKVEVIKKFTLDKDRSIIWFNLKLRNLTTMPLDHRLEVRLFNYEAPGQGTPSFTNPYPRIPMVLCHVNGQTHMRSATAVKGEGSGCTAGGCGMGQGIVNETGEAHWIGAGDRYFLTAVVPTDEPVQRRCELNVLGDSMVKASMLYPQKKLAAGAEQKWNFTIFVGPKNLAALDAIKGPPAVEDVKLHESLEFGWFAVICRPMLWLMGWFHGVVGNWGLSIILLTLVVKLITFYWTHKSMRSMRNMQKLKPQMDKLKEKYGEDKQRLNTEMMSLYKAHNVNPLGGCLPMLIQMPVWFALYRSLGNAVELYRSPFVGWITDLTAPDPFYILPIAMGASMYAQQLITPQPMEGTQAKVMKYVMPGMFTVMMLALPSGLTLYIFVNTLLTIAHQYWMNKSDPINPKGATTAVKPEITPAGQGKGARPKRGQGAAGSTRPRSSGAKSSGKSKKTRKKKKKR